MNITSLMKRVNKENDFQVQWLLMIIEACIITDKLNSFTELATVFAKEKVDHELQIIMGKGNENN